MIRYIDPFGRETIIDILPSLHNNRVGFVVRKERQSVYESWDVTTVKAVINDLTKALEAVDNVVLA